MERVPVLKIGDILLVSIQIDMEDQVALRLQEDLADRIVATGCHGMDLLAAEPDFTLLLDEDDAGEAVVAAP